MRLFELAQQSQRASQLANDLDGRLPFPQVAIVTNNADPENRRRVKVSLQKNAALETAWLDRKLSSPSEDPPVPKVGQTVLVEFYDGDPHRGCYAGILINDVNTAQETDNPLVDEARVIEGDRVESVRQNDRQVIDESQSVKVGKNLKLENTAGAYLELHESGAVILGDAFGNRFVLGGASAGLGLPTDMVMEQGGDFVWDLNGFDLSFLAAGGISINGSQVATVGAPDTDGDTLTGKGWS